MPPTNISQNFRLLSINEQRNAYREMVAEISLATGTSTAQTIARHKEKIAKQSYDCEVTDAVKFIGCAVSDLWSLRMTPEQLVIQERAGGGYGELHIFFTVLVADGNVKKTFKYKNQAIAFVKKNLWNCRYQNWLWWCEYDESERKAA